MDKNLIKKELYKQNPVAEFGFNTEVSKNYSTELIIDGQEEIIEFEVPFSDMGDAKFENEIEAKLLIRWIKWQN